jgi:hypothetical protein
MRRMPKGKLLFQKKQENLERQVGNEKTLQTL